MESQGSIKPLARLQQISTNKPRDFCVKSTGSNRENDEVGTLNAEVKIKAFQFIVPRSSFILSPCFCGKLWFLMKEESYAHETIPCPARKARDKRGDRDSSSV